MIKGKDADIDKLSSSAILEAVQRHGKLYRKMAEVQAHRADQETAVETVLANGISETKNIAAPGDYVVTGPGGERYVVKHETFKTRYARKPGKKDVYVARGQVVALKNPFGRPICVMAEWGEMQHGSENCMIAAIFDPATKTWAGKPFLIAPEEFARTYKLVHAPKTTE